MKTPGAFGVGVFDLAGVGKRAERQLAREDVRLAVAALAEARAENGTPDWPGVTPAQHRTDLVGKSVARLRKARAARRRTRRAPCLSAWAFAAAIEGVL